MAPSASEDESADWPEDRSASAAETSVVDAEPPFQSAATVPTSHARASLPSLVGRLSAVFNLRTSTARSSVGWQDPQEDDEVEVQANDSCMPGVSRKSTVGGSADTAADKLMRFREQRQREQDREFVKLTRCAIHMSCVGLLGYLYGVTGLPGDTWVTALGFWLISTGLVLLSTCPSDRVDLDALFQEWWKTRATLSFCLALSTLAAILEPGLGFVFMLPATVVVVAFGIGRCSSNMAHNLTLFFLVEIFGDSCAKIWNVLVYGYFANIWRGLIQLAFIPPTLCYLAYERNMVSPSRLMLDMMYFYFLSYGCRITVGGVLGVAPVHDELRLYPGSDGAAQIFRGFGNIFPVLFVVIVGREPLYRFVARRLDDGPERKQRAGVFVASLLENSVVEPGDPWWILRDEGEVPWEQGVVEIVREDGFSVRMPGCGSDSGSSGLSGRRSRGELLDVPLSPLTDLGVLARKARESLRCVDASHLTEELFLSGQSVSGVDASRTVVRKETVDFFVTHSWHDDGKAKFVALRRVCRSFARRCGRSPTFWLDKCCIDQSRISDGLRVLPVSILSCSQMLMLLGTTYPTRLWCVWEMFTLLAVHNMDSMDGKLLVLPLAEQGSQEATASANSLLHFSMATARCFDPNEERRLRRVISAVGEDEFSEKVREVARLCLQERPQRGSRSSKWGSTVLRARSLVSSKSLSGRMGATQSDARDGELPFGALPSANEPDPEQMLDEADAWQGDTVCVIQI